MHVFTTATGKRMATLAWMVSATLMLSGIYKGRVSEARPVKSDGTLQNGPAHSEWTCHERKTRTAALCDHTTCPSLSPQLAGRRQNGKHKEIPHLVSQGHIVEKNAAGEKR